MAPTRRSVAPRGRAATREYRREQLIRSTIDSIAKRGFAETTLANVADGAGLSRGIVNFHFQSKEALLVATLQYLAEEYRTTWSRALERAGPSPTERLRALVLADFDPVICNRKKIAVWHAFMGEAKSRPTYMKLCGARDEEYLDLLTELCRAVLAEGEYEPRDPRRLAITITALTDGLWLNLLINPQRIERDAARLVCLEFLGRLFPRHFPPAERQPDAAPRKEA